MDLDSLDLDSIAPQTQAEALSQALQKRRAGGTLASLFGAMSGDKGMAGFGQGLNAEADKMQERGLQAQHYSTEQAKEQAQQEYWKALAGARQTAANTGAQNVELKGTENVSTHDAFGNPVLAPKYGGGRGPLSGLTNTTRGNGGGAGGGGTGPLTPEALDQAAEQFATTGKLMPGMGKATAAINTLIRNRAAVLHPDGNLAGNAAGYGADQASLKKLQTTSDALAGFEGTGLKNLSTFLDSMKGIADTGSPLLNKPVRWLDQNLTGDPKMTTFNAARQVASQEMAKILSGSSGQGAISDSARQEVEHLLPADATLAQMQAAANLLINDAHNRKTSTDAQLAAIRGRASGKPVQPEVAPSPAAGGTIKVRRKSDGKTGSMPAANFNPDMYDKVQ